MKALKQTTCLLLLTVFLCILSTGNVLAADDDLVWFEPEQTSDTTAVHIVTNATVTDGVVELTYDSSVLTYKDVEVTEAYVAMYSVNAEEEGIVRISWVAPGEYEANPSGLSLIQVSFTGKASAKDLSLSGKVYDANGEAVPVQGKTDTQKPEDPKPTAPGTNPPGNGSSGGNNSGSNPSATTNPGTGDSSRPLLLLAVIVCAAAACAGITVMKRRAEK